MYLVYIDDSGDTGFKSAGSPTDAFILSAVIVKDEDWLNTLDQIISFRRFLFQNFGLRQRDELKAGYLIHGTGPFSKLRTSEAARMRIYKQTLRFQQKLGTIKTWAILIDKDKWEGKGWNIGIRDVAWENMIQRIEAYTRYGKENCMIFPDEGHPAFVRGMFRRMRRFNLVQSAYEPGRKLSRPATFIVEDPNYRHSNESYFVQLADMNAYAAYRHIFPESYFGAEYWDELGDAREEKVNRIRGGPTGIVVRP